MFLSSLFIVLGIVGVQPTEDVPVQQTVHTSGIRYEFTHQEKKYILNLNNQWEVLAYYIDNVLQNPDLLPSTKGELLQYKIETKNDLVKTFVSQRSRRTRREAGGQSWISRDTNDDWNPQIPWWKLCDLQPRIEFASNSLVGSGIPHEGAIGAIGSLSSWVLQIFCKK